jgi:hypothetical protein
MIAGFTRRYPKHTKAQAERAEVSEREAIYNRRYNQNTDIAFRVYYDEHYLPWLKEKKPSQVVDAESRIKKLKEFFGNRMLPSRWEYFTRALKLRLRLEELDDVPVQD